ncbi:MAG: SGNH/GDSL hydrolase family protein [Planctomycetota bacterium]|nr:SGNH/GDSL hydrolase family protein [Planctomycetota bacterium]
MHTNLIFIPILTLLPSLVFEARAEIFPADSLLRNGGFETTDPKTGAPSHWVCSDWSAKEARGKISLSSEAEGVAEGKKSARIKYEGKGSNLVVYQDVARRGVGSYSLTAKCKAYGGSVAYVSIVAFFGNEILQYENSGKVKGSEVWQEVVLPITTDAKTEKIRIILRSNGDAAFDEVSFVTTGKASGAEPSSGTELRTKNSTLSSGEKADLDRKAKMSPDELAWEKVLEQNLGGFYLPLYKKAKAESRTTAWDYVTDDPALPRVLLIGDSISRGYTVPARKLMTGKVNLHRAPANCGPTSQGLKMLDVWLGDGKWDLIHFNFGIHDRNSKAEDYAARLEQIIVRLKLTGAKLIWATSTPLPDDSKTYKKGDCARLNAAASEVIEKHAIANNDLYSAIQPHLANYQNPGDCHFNGPGYEFLGQRVADAILSELAK